MTKRNPFKYNGSGKYWIHHIQYHGKQYIQTIEVFGFDDQKICTEFALSFSKFNHIVESEQWANLKDEDGDYKVPWNKGKKTGISSWNKGLTASTDERIASYANKQRGIAKHTKHTLAIIQSKREGFRHTAESCERMSASRKGRAGRRQTQETKNKLSAAKIGKSIDRSKPGKNQRPITIDGIWYCSANEASRKTGLSVYKVLKMG